MSCLRLPDRPHRALFARQLPTQLEVSTCPQDLPDTLMPFLRLAHCQDEQALRHPSLQALQQPLPAEQERALLANLASCLQRRLNRCAHMCFQEVEVCSQRGGG